MFSQLGAEYTQIRVFELRTALSSSNAAYITILKYNKNNYKVL